MYAKSRVDHNRHREAIEEELDLMGRITRSTNTPYSFLFCSEYCKRRFDGERATPGLDPSCSSKYLEAKPDLQDRCCGSSEAPAKVNSKKRAVRTGGRVKRLVVYRRVRRDRKRVEHIYEVGNLGNLRSTNLVPQSWAFGLRYSYKILVVTVNLLRSSCSRN